MKRREALKYSGYLTAAGLSAGTISAIVSGCKSPAPAASEIAGWNVDEIDQLKAITNVIIPKTDTPGAVEAGVAKDLAQHVNDNFTQEEQDMFRAGLVDLQERCKSAHNRSFAELEIEDQESILNAIADEGGDPNLFEVIKGMTVYLFFTSEVGATQVLSFLPIPGEYEPCIDYADIGATWAL